MKNKISYLILVLLSSFIFGCNTNNEKVEKKTVEKDEKPIEEYYKQFDSTITKENLDSFRRKVDSLQQYRDSKRKKTPF